MVPYGQAAYSETGENMETYGQTHSHGTLRVGCALRDRQEQIHRQEQGDLRSNSLAGPYRRLCTEDTSENREQGDRRE